MRTDLVVVGLLIAVTLAGCSGPVRKDAVPPELTTRAEVPGLAGVSVKRYSRSDERGLERDERSEGHQSPAAPCGFCHTASFRTDQPTSGYRR